MSKFPKKIEENAVKAYSSDKKKRKSDPKNRRRFKSLAISGVAADLLDRSFRQKGFIQTRIVRDWRQIVGPELGAVTIPLRAVFPRGQRINAVLHIRCTSAFAPLLQHRCDEIINTVNQYFGYGALKDIQVRQGPLPKRRRSMAALESAPLSGDDQKRLDGLLTNIKKSDLASALRSLGSAVFKSVDRS